MFGEKIFFRTFASFGRWEELKISQHSLHFKNENCTIDRMMKFVSHLLARFPGDYGGLLIHTVGSLVEGTTTRMMAVRTAAGSRDCALTIPKRRSAVGVDFVRQFERLRLLPAELAAAVAPELVGELAGSGCGAIVVFQCSLDRGWGGDER
jgi:hypothetical protein